MSPPLHIADALALRYLGQNVKKACRSQLLTDLTDLVEDQALGFPREVVKDLIVLSSDDQLIGWAHGLGSKLDPWEMDITYYRALMATVATLNPAGFQSLDGKDTSVAAVGQLCHQLEDQGTDFVGVTDDFSDTPFGPNFAQICQAKNWTVVGPNQMISNFGLSHLF